MFSSFLLTALSPFTWMLTIMGVITILLNILESDVIQHELWITWHKTYIFYQLNVPSYTVMLDLKVNTCIISYFSDNCHITPYLSLICFLYCETNDRILSFVMSEHACIIFLMQSLIKKSEYWQIFHCYIRIILKNPIVEIVRVWITINGLPPQHFRACRKLGPGFLTPNAVVFLCSIGWGGRWLFGLLILVTLLTITVAFAFKQEWYLFFSNRSGISFQREVTFVSNTNEEAWKNHNN